MNLAEEAREALMKLPSKQERRERLISDYLNCLIINLDRKVDEFISLCSWRILEIANNGGRQIVLKIHWETNYAIEFLHDEMMNIEAEKRFLEYIYSSKFLSKLSRFCKLEGLKVKITSVRSWDEHAEEIVISW